MEGGLFLVFIIIALVARAIEAMTKGKGGQQPPLPPQRRPRAGQEQPYGTRPRERPSAADGVPADATEDAAAAMIPDDLWEILTGRPKPQPSGPQPAPQPRLPEQTYADAADDVAFDDVLHDRTAEYERQWRVEQAQRELEHEQLMDRRLREQDMHTADKAPIVYSLERPLPPAAVRHATFHEKLEVPVVQKRRTRRPDARQWLFSGDDMKRAIVLQEVLGPPRGLE